MDPEHGTEAHPETIDVRLTLDGAWSIRNAIELRDRLREALDSRRNIIVNCAAVEACDVAAFQLIASFGRTAAAQGQTVRFENISPAMVEAGAAIGYDSGEPTEI